MPTHSLETLIQNFSPDALAEWLDGKKNFSPAGREDLDDFDGDGFSRFEILGHIETEKKYEHVLVVTARAAGELSERASRKKQYDLAKKILKQNQSFPAGIFVFYDTSGNFRFSLVVSDYEGDKRTFSHFKRYTYFVSPKERNKTFLQQIGPADFNTLSDIREAFSVAKVTKEFYFGVSAFFHDMVNREKENLALPDESEHSGETRKEFAVRLIGRIVFCWFLKHKGTTGKKLIPDEILSSKAVKEGYYHGVLEILFFQVLNKEKESRDARDEFFDAVPYLNGGLFSAQTEDYYDFRRDAFASVHVKTLKVSDAWLRGFLDLLESFNFTVDENTESDQEVSVDPEMLGKIFENLLAEAEGDGKESERKRTGSFYTPRSIVEYMVDESLCEYLKTRTKMSVEKIEALVSWDTEDDKLYPLSDAEKEDVVRLMDACAVLDPACGSGAFPMGMLQKMAHILHQVDPECKIWLAQKLQNVPELFRKKIIDEVVKNPFEYTRKKEVINQSIFGADIQPIAVDIARLRFFLTLIVDASVDDTKKNRGIEPLPNLDFKFVCANTLIPVPEASSGENATLFEDEFQKNLAREAERYFSSSGEEKKDVANAIHRLIDEKVNKKIQYALGLRSYNGEEKFEQALAEKNKKNIATASGAAVLWGSYKNIFENKPVGFFDTRYFFPSVKNGFDIVIGNPPYIQLQKFRGSPLQDAYKKAGFETYDAMGDIYGLFYEKGLSLAKPETGLLCFITSNKWMRAGYGEKLRGFFAKKNPVTLLDFGGVKVFESATVDTNILLIRNTSGVETQNFASPDLQDLNQDSGRDAKFFVSTGGMRACRFGSEYKKGEEVKTYFEKNFVPLKNLSSETWFIGSAGELALKEKIERTGKPLKEWEVKIYRGVLTGLNEAFVIDQQTHDRLVSEDPKSAEILKPILRGRDIKRYGYAWAGLYLVMTGFDRDIPKEYPAVFEYLKTFETKAKKRDDRGRDWWNLRACAYYEEFEKEKVVWSDIATQPTFQILEDGVYFNNTAYMVSGENPKYFVGVLNSKIIKFYFPLVATGLGEKGNRYFKQFVELLPIPSITSENQEIISQIESLVDQILTLKKSSSGEGDTSALERQIDEAVYRLYNLTEEEIKIVEGK